MKRKIFFTLAFTALIGMGIAAYFIYAVYGNNIKPEADGQIITIYPGSDYAEVRQQLLDSNILQSGLSFDLIAKMMRYNDQTIKDGKYQVKTGWSNRDLIGMLRGGFQLPVKVTFNNVRDISGLCGALAKYFYADSIAICNYLKGENFLAENNITPAAALSLFIPNTYEMYWNYSPEKIADRLITEYDNFWSKDNREAKARELNMSREEVYTLASIVEKESNYKPERRRMAGVYLNRLQRGIPLQADPTVVYAIGDFSIRRVLNSHLEFDSPYNTYKYSGLPPGPIYMPSIDAIDAVLNAEKHEYLYFCAKPGYGSEHAFAKTLRQHNVNAANYQRWLNQEGIR